MENWGNKFDEGKPEKIKTFGEIFTIQNFKDYLRSRMALIGVIAACAAVAKLCDPADNIDQYQDQCGNVIYQHSDRQTNHILNYLTGKEADNSNDLSEYLHDEKHSKDISALIKKREFNQKYYQTLWKIFKQNGSPKIRWGTDKSWLMGDSNSEAYYNPLNNSVHVDPYLLKLENQKDSFKDFDLIGELAHARQFHAELPYTLWRLPQTGWRVLKARVLKGQSWKKSYELEYEIPGSIEYEAHHDIEPKLESQVKKTFENNQVASGD